jgi:hypothetical protein
MNEQSDRNSTLKKLKAGGMAKSLICQTVKKKLGRHERAVNAIEVHRKVRAGGMAKSLICQTVKKKLGRHERAVDAIEVHRNVRAVIGEQAPEPPDRAPDAALRDLPDAALHFAETSERPTAGTVACRLQLTRGQENLVRVINQALKTKATEAGLALGLLGILVVRVERLRIGEAKPQNPKPGVGLSLTLSLRVNRTRSIAGIDAPQRRERDIEMRR